MVDKRTFVILLLAVVLLAGCRAAGPVNKAGESGSPQLTPPSGSPAGATITAHPTSRVQEPLGSPTPFTGVEPSRPSIPATPAQETALTGTPGSGTQASTQAASQTPASPESTAGQVPAETLPSEEPDFGFEPPEYPITGVELHTVNREGGLELARQADAYWLRRNSLKWSEIEPREGERRWAAVAGVEQEMIHASESGMQLILTIMDAPGWAQGKPGYSCGPVAEEKLEAFARFLQDAVARYSVPPYNLLYWEIGNEPDAGLGLVPPDSIFGCWGDVNDRFYGGEYYGKMLSVVYPQMKAANPDIEVLIGGLMLACDPVNPSETFPGSGQINDCSSTRFLDGVLESGGGDYFDGLSFHAYDYYYESLGLYGSFNWHSSSWETGPLLITKARYLREVLSSYGYRDKYMINTESGLICAAADSICQTDDFETTKAYYIAQANASARAEGLRGNVWYSITGWRYSGLVSFQLQPYPVYDAFKFSSEQLNRAIYKEQIHIDESLMGFAFQRPETDVWILWSLDGEKHPVIFPERPDRVYDVFGSALPAEPALEIGLMPLYIEWPHQE